MGNTGSTPLQTCLSTAFSDNQAGLAFPSNPLYQLQYVKPYNLDIPVTPVAITRPTDSAQIADVLQCATEADVKVQARSGGHSYGNYGLGGESGAVVVDLVEFQDFSMNEETWEATIGSGTLLDDITSQLHDNGNRAMAHGTCPQVGIGGHATIGGLGPTSRMWGAALDHILEVEVVLANGTITRASNSVNPDLFFALKGAAASFGVITKFKVRTHREPSQSVQYSYTFTPSFSGGWEDMAPVFEAWQTMISDPKLSRKFASQVLISEVGMIISGTFFGTQAEYDSLGLEDKLPKAPAFKSVVLKDWLGSVAHWAEDVAQEAGGGIPSPFYSKSLAFRNDTLLSSPTVKGLFRLFGSSVEEKGTLVWFAIFDLEGGAINDVPMTATAYAHRDALFYIQTYAVGIPHVSSKTKKFLTNINEVVTSSMPDAQLGAYAGYVDPALANAQEKYWGENYPRLQTVKRRYDPGDLFHNPQSVRA